MKQPTKTQVAARRKQCRLTQRVAAAIMQTTISTWQKWEYGQNPMPAIKWDYFLRESDKFK